jgi:predicted signal transduction protein with EAL and GGDEF domain
VLFVGAYATPMFYDHAAAAGEQYGARVVMFAVAVTGETIAMRWLKLRAEEHQRRMAERDPLTGVHNRRAFDAALASAAPRENTALLLFDFDDFKSVNDVHGHPAGDAVPRAIALAGAGAVRESDHLARIGGDVRLGCRAARRQRRRDAAAAPTSACSSASAAPARASASDWR